MRKKHFDRRHPAFDGGKSLYAASSPLFQGNLRSDRLKLLSGEGETSKEYVVTIKMANKDVELTFANLFKYMRSANACSMRVPSDTIQCVDVALRGDLPSRL